MATRTWLTLGATVSIYGLVAVSCSPVEDADGTPRITPGAATEVSVSSDAHRLNSARVLWAEESGADGDPFTAAKAAYDIAAVTKDPKWAHTAGERFTIARQEMPGFAQATAWHGSAHALIARDFPIQGAWQALPGPGFVRIYHVKRAQSLLDEAVAQDEHDPVVRLVRAATVIGMPSVLVDHSVAWSDFQTLAEWESNPGLNPTYAVVLQNDEWRRGFWAAYADALAGDGQLQAAERIRANAVASIPSISMHQEQG